MSVRLEWTIAPHAFPGVYGRGQRLEDGNTVAREYGMVMHTLVVEGTYDELLSMLDQARERLQRRHRSDIRSR